MKLSLKKLSLSLSLKPNRSNRKYTEVRKVAHDTLWHAIFVVKGRESWDRVSQKEALQIAKDLHDVSKEDRLVSALQTLSSELFNLRLQRSEQLPTP